PTDCCARPDYTAASIGGVRKGPGAWAVETKGLRLRAFGQVFRSFSSDSYGYLPQTIEKPDSKSLCLAPLVSTAQTPRLAASNVPACGVEGSGMLAWMHAAILAW